MFHLVVKLMVISGTCFLEVPTIYIYIHPYSLFEDYVRGYAPQIWLNMVWHIYYPLFVGPESPIQEG